MTREQALERYTKIANEIIVLQHEANDLKKIILAQIVAPERPINTDHNATAIRGSVRSRCGSILREYAKPLKASDVARLGEMNYNSVSSALADLVKQGYAHIDEHKQYSIAVFSDANNNNASSVV